MKYLFAILMLTSSFRATASENQINLQVVRAASKVAIIYDFDDDSDSTTTRQSSILFRKELSKLIQMSQKASSGVMLKNATCLEFARTDRTAHLKYRCELSFVSTQMSGDVVKISLVHYWFQTETLRILEPDSLVVSHDQKEISLY